MSSLILESMTELRGVQSLIHSDLDGLESFVAWSEQIKLDMSECNPLLYQVLGNIAFSMNPIAGGDSSKTKPVQASFLENAHQHHLVEQKTKEARELQIRNEGRQLGCLLVQRSKGETQLRATKWFAATNGSGELGQRGKEGRRKQQRKEKGEAYSPQPRAYQGKGEHQLPNSARRACRDKLEPKGGKREKGAAYNPQPPWCNFCWKTGHTAQACWWNTSAQQQKHKQKNTWRSPRRKKQLQRDNGDQSFADWLASNKSLMSSFEKSLMSSFETQSQDKSLAM